MLISLVSFLDAAVFQTVPVPYSEFLIASAHHPSFSVNIQRLFSTLQLPDFLNSICNAIIFDHSSIQLPNTFLRTQHEPFLTTLKKELTNSGFSIFDNVTRVKKVKKVLGKLICLVLKFFSFFSFFVSFDRLSSFHRFPP